MNYPFAPSFSRSLPYCVSGFLLAGGGSRRMGRDKALIPIAGQPLLLHLAQMAGPLLLSLSVIGPPERYAHLCAPLGFPVLGDLRPGQGPLGGIEAALAQSSTDWNLILACDMPFLESAWLEELMKSALSQPPGVLCVASAQQDAKAALKQSPLCACWHKAALPLVRQALDQSHLRVRDLLDPLGTQYCFPAQPRLLANWNSLSDVD